MNRHLNLQKTLLSGPHLYKLQRAYRDFRLFCSTKGRRCVFERKRPKASEVNEGLIGCIQHLFSSGRPYSDSIHAILGVKRAYRHLQSRLRHSWDSVKSWLFRCQVRLRTPMPRAVCMALVCSCFQRESSQTLPEHSLGCLWVYYALSPLGCDLVREDVALPSSSLLPCRDKAILSIRNQRTKRLGGRIQFSVCTWSPSLLWLEWICCELPRSHKLFPLSPPSLRTLFHIACADIGLDTGTFTPSSLREGGTTDRFLAGEPVASIKFRGRWLAESSLEHAAALLSLQHIPLATQQWIQQTTALLLRGPLPPQAPWWHFFDRKPVKGPRPLHISAA